jgi:ribosomal protein L35
MPKLKTSKSAAKRVVKVTSKGKILIKKMSAQHRAKGKSKRSLAHAMSNFEVSKANIKTIKKLIPYR